MTFSRPYLIVVLWMIFSMLITYGQKQSSSTTGFDTAIIVVRICKGDLPGQKRDLSKDYYPQVCAYTFNNDKLVIYTVTGFDLVYRDTFIDSTDIASAKSNLFTPKMRNMIIRADKNLTNLFFDNIILAKKTEKIVIRGLRPLIPLK